MKEILIIFLLAGFLSEWSAGQCGRLNELWTSDQTSHCTGQPTYTVRDMILQVNGNCSCPGEILAYMGELRDGDNGADGLDGPRSVVVSPEGNHLYVAGTDENTIGVFGVDPDTGLLSFIESHRNWENGVEGLWFMQALTVSPDGKHLYAGSGLDDAIVTFERDAITGRLSFSSVIRDGEGGVDGLNTVRALTLSSDGNFLYSAASGDDAIGVFQRDSVTGALTFLEIHRHEVNGVDGLNGVRFLAISSDGLHLYSAGHVYNEDIQESAVAVFDRDPVDGTLSFVQAKHQGAEGITDLLFAKGINISTDGNFVYTAGEDYDFKGFVIDSSVAVFQRNPVSGTLTFVGAEREGINGVHGLLGAVFPIPSSDGNYLYVSGFSADSVVVFQRDGATGQLSFVETEQNEINGVEGLDGPISLALSPDNDHLFAVARVDDSVTIFNRDPLAGTLSYVENVQDREGGVDGLDGVAAVISSADGNQLYVASETDNAIAVLQRNTANGSILHFETLLDDIDGVDGLFGATALTLSPDGNHLYAVAQGDDSVAAFERNPASGALSFMEVHRDGVAGVDGLDRPRSLVLSSDGNHLYAASQMDHAVAVFERESSTGSLSFVEMQREGVNGVDGLFGAFGVALSPDGNHLYVTGSNDDALAVFQRNALTGSLTFSQAHHNGVEGIDGLNVPRFAMLNPTGNHLYAICASAILLFERDGATGALSFMEVFREGENGIEGLPLAKHAILNDAGNRLYVAASGGGGTVTVFERNTTTGTLTFREIHRDGSAGAHGLQGAISLALSPANDFLYAVGQTDDALATFLVFPPF